MLAEDVAKSFLANVSLRQVFGVSGGDNKGGSHTSFSANDEMDQCGLSGPSKWCIERVLCLANGVALQASVLFRC